MRPTRSRSFSNPSAVWTRAAGCFASSRSTTPSNADGKLQIAKTPNQNSPYMDNHAPVMGIDVWEHAYYLKYQNKRGDYVDAWWNVVNWNAVAERFSKAKAGTL